MSFRSVSEQFQTTHHQNIGFKTLLDVHPGKFRTSARPQSKTSCQDHFTSIPSQTSGDNLIVTFSRYFQEHKSESQQVNQIRRTSQ